MKKFILKLTKLTIIVYVLLNVIAYMSLWLLSTSEFYKPSYIANHFQENTQFDHVILGSSRGLTTINTNVIDEELNTKSVNLSIDDTGLPTHMLMLTHFFKQNLKTKKVILTLDKSFFSKNNNECSDNDYRFLPFVFNDYVSDYYHQYEQTTIKKLYFSKYSPFLGVAYYNLELFFPSLISSFKPNKHNRFDANGNYQYPNSSFVTTKKGAVGNKIIDNPMLLELQRICEKNNARLFIYIAPMFNSELTVSTSLNMELINHTGIIKSSAGFYDNIHVNKYGREIATKALIKHLQ